jgi:acyl transferase
MSTYAFDTHETRLADGRRLALWSLQPARPQRSTPLVIGAGFSRRMHHFSSLAMYAAYNGHASYRYDPVNHVGLSEGEMSEYTMTDGLESLRAAVDWAHARHGERVGVVATSLTARIALELAAESEHVAFVVCAVGVVHVRRTLISVFGTDYLGMAPGDLPELATFEGNRIRPAVFCADAHARDWGSLEGTTRALARVRQPVTNFIGSDDTWVDPDEVRAVFSKGHAGPRRLYTLARGAHDLGRNPAVAHAFLLKTTEEIGRLVDAEGAPVEPSFEALTNQALLERRLQRAHAGHRAGEEKAVWQ